MTAMTDEDAKMREQRARRWGAGALRFAILVVFGLSVFVLALSPPAVANAAELDPSWLMLLAEDLRSGARFGVDTVFTYGPLAAYVVHGASFEAELWTPCLVGGLARALVTAIGLALALRRAKFAALALAGIVLYLGFPLYGDALWVVLVASYALLALEALEWRGRQKRIGGEVSSRAAILLVAAACLPLALLGLVKFTIGVQAWICLALLGLRASMLRTRLVFVLIAVAVLGFVGPWLALGQRLADLPAYLRGGLQIARGYNDAAALPGDALQFVLLVLMGVCTACALLVRATEEGMARAVRIAVLALSFGVAWKSAVVRQDGGHEVTCFLAGALLVLLATAGAGGRVARWLPALSVVLCGLGLCGIAGYGIEGYGIEGYREASRPAQLLELAKTYSNPSRAKARREATAALQRQLLDLPRTRARVGDEAIDCMTDRTGVLLRGGFRVRHRPIFQSDSAYGPELQLQNARFFAGPRAPRFLAVKLKAIDGRLPMVDDSAAWLEILDSYAPVFFERGFALFERDERARRGPRSTAYPVLRVDTTLGTRVELPEASSVEHVQTLAVSVERSLLGDARALLCDAPRLDLELVFVDGQSARYRISRGGARLPFVLQPFLGSTQDLLAAYAGQARRVRSVAVLPGEGEEGFWKPGVRLAFGERAALARRAKSLDGTPMETLAGHARLEIASLDAGVRVLEVDARGLESTPFGEVPAFEPGSSLTLAVASGRYAVRIEYGLLAEAWGVSDGMEMVVTRQDAASGVPREVYRRRFAAEVGGSAQGFTVDAAELSFERSTRLRIFFTPGASGDRRGDRAFVRRLEILKADSR